MMASIEKAVEIAARAHAGTRDKQGGAYLSHPLRVMMDVEGTEAQIVAALHDCVEDTEISLDDLRAAGFSESIVDAVAHVTHDDDQSYAEYVIAAKSNAIARQVKLADLRDNMRPDRVLLREDRSEPDLKRIQRYILSYQYLIDRLDESDYRRRMRTLES